MSIDIKGEQERGRKIKEEKQRSTGGRGSMIEEGRRTEKN